MKKMKKYLKIHHIRKDYYAESKAITQTANKPLLISTTCFLDVGVKSLTAVSDSLLYSFIFIIVIHVSLEY